LNGDCWITSGKECIDVWDAVSRNAARNKTARRERDTRLAESDRVHELRAVVKPQLLLKYLTGNYRCNSVSCRWFVDDAS